MKLMMDENNFSLHIGKWHIAMVESELEINNVSYEDDPDNPIYDFVREIRNLKIQLEAK